MKDVKPRPQGESVPTLGATHTRPKAAVNARPKGEVGLYSISGLIDRSTRLEFGDSPL